MYEPSGRERFAAAAMHVGSIFAPIIAPAAGYVCFRGRSEFVTAHSLRALKEWLALKLCLLLAGLASLSYSIYRLIDLYRHDWKDFSPWEFLLRMAIGFLVLSLVSLVTQVLSVIDAFRAFVGRWPRGSRHTTAPYDLHSSRRP